MVTKVSSCFHNCKEQSPGIDFKSTLSTTIFTFWAVYVFVIVKVFVFIFRCLAQTYWGEVSDLGQGQLQVRYFYLTYMHIIWKQGTSISEKKTWEV